MDAQRKEEYIYKSTKSKIDRYKWQIVDIETQGEFKLIPKHNLIVNHQFQREFISKNNISIFASKWSWIGCGTLTVVEIDGVAYIVDGQHRWIAANKRADIDSLPCMVFKLDEKSEAAKAFLLCNTTQKPVYQIDKYNILLTQEDEAAIGIKSLLEKTGHKVVRHAQRNSLSCIGILLKSYKVNKQITWDLWPLCADIHAGEPIHGRIWEGLFYLENYLRQNDKTLLTDLYSKKLISTGKAQLLQDIGTASAFYAAGGAKVYAEGILKCLNFKRKEENRINFS